jgi:hypothetical protein
MLKDGSYVYMVLAPESRRGTIHEAINHKGEPQFLFRLDPRFDDKLEDFFIYDGDVEECERPSDQEIAVVNALIAHGSNIDE